MAEPMNYSPILNGLRCCRDERRPGRREREHGPAPIAGAGLACNQPAPDETRDDLGDGALRRARAACEIAKRLLRDGVELTKHEELSTAQADGSLRRARAEVKGVHDATKTIHRTPGEQLGIWLLH